MVGLAGVCPSCSQKRESTVFKLILQSAWGLSSPSKQVGGSSTAGAKFGVKKVNGGKNICSVGNGKHFEKQVQPSKG